MNFYHLKKACEDNYIPINKVGQPYLDAYSYLDAQSRLLKNDMLAPYKEALQKLGIIS
jgi:hypothetical protein